MEYYGARKRNKILILTTTRMNLRNVIPHKRNHTEKAMCRRILFTGNSRKGKLIYSERKQISNPPEWKSGSTAKG